MLRSTLTALTMVPLLLLFSGSSGKSAPQSPEQNSKGQTGTLENISPIEIQTAGHGEVQSSVLPARGGVAPSVPAFVPGPDIITGDVGETGGLQHFGSSGTKVGLSMSTTSCNAGNVPVNFFALPATSHPVIPQNLYRMSDGPGNADRFEQIGQSWVKHSLGADQLEACFACTPGDFTHLGVGCSDTYDVGLNADQSVLGSRAWINPFTGVFQSSANNHSGHTHTGTSHRLLVEGSDLNTTLNPGATYYAEAQYISPDEYDWCQTHPGECNQYNNASYRRFDVSGTTSFTFSAVGAAVRMAAAIHAWTGATINPIEPVPGIDGRAFIAFKVTNPSAGVWHYEYALYNENLDRGIQSFSVPLGCGITLSNLGFHAPLNHPGFPDDGTLGNAGFSNAAWTSNQTPGAVTWSSETFAQNQNANAIRWGTLYNFRFDSDKPPQVANATIGFFKTGAPITVEIQGPVPNSCGTPTPSPTVTPGTPTPTPTPPPETFVKAINLNGDAAIINGNNWTSYSTALATGFTTSNPTYDTSITYTPPVDSDTNGMLNTGIWCPECDIDFSQTLPNGNYVVHLWEVENFETDYRSYDVKLEGVQVASAIGSLPNNTWQRYGPYSVTVSDGTLDVNLVRVTGDPVVHGIEIWSTDTPTPAPSPTATLSPSPTPTPTPIPTPTPGCGDTVSLLPQRDNTLFEDSAGQLSNGSGIYLFAGATGVAGLRRGLIAFDFASIPANATITGVTLSLFLSKTHGGPAAVSLSKVSQDWGEGASDAGDPGGGGAPAEAGDATWLHTFYNTGFWTTPGGDFSPTSSATTTVTIVGNTYTWSGSGLVADVQAWVSNAASNFGWVIRANEITAGKAQRFNSRENSINPPQLAVTYQVSCATPTPISISGSISLCSNPVPGPVPNVTLSLTGSASGSTLSGISGNYMLSFLAAGGSYTVTPLKAALPTGSAGINTVDVIATQGHVLGRPPLLTGCRLTAADVDQNGSVNTIDVIAVQAFALARTSGFANTGKYKFSPISRTYSGITSDQSGQDYDTLVFGDVVSPFVE